jgi:uncharacterized protein
MLIPLAFLALLGHGFLWVAAINRLHGRGWPRPLVKVLTALMFAVIALAPLGFGWWLARQPSGVLALWQSSAWPWPHAAALLFYVSACWAGSVVMLARWLRGQVLRRPPAVLRRHSTRAIAVGPGDCPNFRAAGDCPNSPGTVAERWSAKMGLSSSGTSGAKIGLFPAFAAASWRFVLRLPGNEVLRPELTELAIEVPRLPAALDGLAIVHLSDFHFTGRVEKGYFQEVVRACNQLAPDLVIVTGDLVDNSRYIDWIPETLGRLAARHGVFCVLGNHDLLVDTPRLVGVLQRSGLVYLGGEWRQIEVRGQRIVLAGNEAPWLPAADVRDCPPRDQAPLRIAVAHSPDQLAWARGWDADLLLTGHTHGGQIRLPLVGPIFSSTRLGVLYASGLFHEPPTILHITRGVSSELPVRWNCPPEIASLVLRGVLKTPEERPP